MDIKSYMLDKVITWILGGDLFNEIKSVVTNLVKKDIPGEEKRKIAVAEIEKIGGNIAIFLVNLGVEAAVYLLKKEQARVSKK